MNNNNNVKWEINTIRDISYASKSFDKDLYDWNIDNVRDFLLNNK